MRNKAVPINQRQRCLPASCSLVCAGDTAAALLAAVTPRCSPSSERARRSWPARLRGSPRSSLPPAAPAAAPLSPGLPGLPAARQPCCHRSPPQRRHFPWCPHLSLQSQPGAAVKLSASGVSAFLRASLCYPACFVQEAAEAS